MFYCTTVHTKMQTKCKGWRLFDWRNKRRKLFLKLSLHWTPSLRLLIFWYPLTHEVYLYLVTHQLLTDCATLYYQDTAPAATAAQQLQLRSESWHLFTCSPPPPPPLFTDPHTGAPLKTTFYRFGSNVVELYSIQIVMPSCGIREFSSYISYNPHSVHYK